MADVAVAVASPDTGQVMVVTVAVKVKVWP